MKKLNLKKIIQKPRVFDLLNFMTKNGVEFIIFDENEEIVYKNTESKKLLRFSIEFNKNLIGWIKSSEIVVKNFLENIIIDEIEKKEVINNALEKYKEITLLYDFADNIHNCSNVKEIGNLIIKEAENFFKADLGMVQMFDDETGDYQMIANFGSNNFDKEKSDLQLNVLRKHIYSKAKSEIINEFYHDLRFEKVEIYYKSIICCPIKSKDKVIGFITIASKQENNYTASDLRLLSTIASQSSNAIENQMLISELENIIARRTNELSYSQERFKKIVEITSDLVWETNSKGHYSYVSPRTYDLLGYFPNEVLGKSPVVFMNEESSLLFLNTINNCIENKESFSYLEIKCKHKNENIVILEVSGTPIVINEKVEGFRGIYRDVTQRYIAEIELTKAKEEAEKANNAKSEFLANISHEIRTPLNAIIGFSKLLNSQQIDTKSKEFNNTIYTSANTLLTLINDILDLSKVEAGKLEIMNKPIYLKNLFHELNVMFSLKSSEKNICLKFEIDDIFVHKIFIDETRIRQILINLVGNAVKFTDKGCVNIKAYSKENATVDQIDLVLEVSDTGIGIPEHQLGIIFESFRQVSGQSYRKYGGTGLGLAITKRLVELMNGNITVESIEGKGSTFKIIIPDVFIALNEKIENLLNEGLFESDENKEEFQNEEFNLNSIKNKIEKSFKTDKLKQIEEIQKLLKTRIIKEFEYVNRSSNTKQIKIFAETLISIDEKYNVNWFTDYSNELVNQTQQFNIENMKKVLKYFPELMQFIDSFLIKK